MKTASAICALLLVALTSVATADDAPDVELHWSGRTLATPGARDDVLQVALRVLQTSNLHSGPEDAQRIFKTADVQAHYRKEVSGRYLLVSFPTAQWMHTVGGQIRVSQIVIGLNLEEYASSLFTIDDSGRIVEHAKYSGVACVELFNTIRRVTQ